MKSTVYCYDRFAPVKRLGAGALLLLGAAAVFAMSSGSAEAAAKVERLPTVVVTGQAVKVERLPTVVVEGRRQGAPVLAAEESSFKRVAYVPPARY